MDADEFRDYILGFIFYKYLSEKMKAYADDILEADGITYQTIDERSGEGKKYLEAIREEAVESLGYFLKPSELFSSVARRGNGNGKHGDTFILEDLQRILNNIEHEHNGDGQPGRFRSPLRRPWHHARATEDDDGPGQRGFRG
jgi:type I restriction enzyme M protein